MSGQVIAIGTDIIECSRIATMIEKHGDVFLSRVFTAGEIEYSENKKSSYQHFAGRWAAKEAVLKALGTGWSQGIQWTDVEVIRHPEGSLSVQLHGRGAEVAGELGIHRILLSISHTRDYAVAFATAIS